MKSVLDELVPAAKRGKYIIGGFVNAECLPQNDCTGSEEQYEKVDTYYNAGINGTNYAVARWKKRMDADGKLR